MILIGFSQLGINQVLAAPQTLRREVIIVAPIDDEKGPLTDQVRLDTFNFVRDHFKQDQIYPTKSDGTPLAINDWDTFKRIFCKRIQANARRKRRFELTIFFLNHGNIKTKNEEKYLVIAPGRGLGPVEPFSRYLDLITKVIYDSGMEDRISLNIAVGSCHGGQCVTDFEKHPLVSAPYPRAIFGFAGPDQTIYAKAWLDLWAAADRMEQTLAEMNATILPTGSQFERWAYLLSAHPIWIADTKDQDQYQIGSVSSGTLLKHKDLSLEELVALAVAYPHLPRASSNYSKILTRLRDHLRKNGDELPKFDALMTQKYVNSPSAAILYALIIRNHDKTVQTIIDAANRVDIAKHMRREFLYWLLSTFAESSFMKEIKLQDELRLALEIQKEIMFLYHRWSSYSIDNPLLKEGRFEMQFLRLALIHWDHEKLKRLFVFARQKSAHERVYQAADVEFTQSVDFRSQDDAWRHHENHENPGELSLLIHLMMTEEPELVSWAEGKIMQIASSASPSAIVERNFLRQAIKDAVRMWKDPHYQAVVAKISLLLNPSDCEGAALGGGT